MTRRILFLIFFIANVSAPAFADDECLTTLAMIERLWGRINVVLTMDGELKIPRNHLVFKYWRSRVDPSIPDEAFGLYFLSHEQKIAWLEKKSIAAARAEFEAAPPRVRQPEIEPPLAEITLERTWSFLDALPDDWLNTLFGVKIKEQRFLIVEWRGQTEMLASDRWTHYEMAERLKAIYPGMRLLSAGYISLTMRKKLLSDTLKVSKVEFANAGANPVGLPLGQQIKTLAQVLEGDPRLQFDPKTEVDVRTILTVGKLYETWWSELGRLADQLPR